MIKKSGYLFFTIMYSLFMGVLAVLFYQMIFTYILGRTPILFYIFLNFFAGFIPSFLIMYSAKSHLRKVEKQDSEQNR